MSNKKVGIPAFSLILSVIFLGVDENLDLLTVLSGSIKFLNSFLGTLLSLKLDITLSSAVTSGECFEFA